MFFNINIETTSINQYLAILCANLLSFAYGTTAGWTSSTLLLLMSDDLTPLQDGALSTDKLSWITSLISVGGSIGTIVFGFLAKNMGKKLLLIVCSLPLIFSWILIIFSTNAIYLYISRFCSGFAAGGSFILVPLFVSEIAEDRIRGELGSLLMLTANSGVLLAFILGNYLKFVSIACVHICFPLLFLFTFIFFPDTPYHYLRIKKPELAKTSLEFYRNAKTGCPESSSNIQKELELIQNCLKCDNQETIKLADFLHRPNKKAFIIGLMLVTLHEICGVFVMTNYTATIFTESGSNISPTMSAIIVGVVQLLGTFVSAKLVDKAGRKFLYIISLLGSGSCLLVLAAYTYFNSLGFDVEPYSWISVASFSLMFFFACCGVIPLPYVVMFEIMSQEFRSIGTTVCFIYSWVLSFVLVKYFPLVILQIGMHGSILCFAISCFFGTLLILFMVPETKGKSFKEISLIMET